MATGSTSIPDVATFIAKTTAERAKRLRPEGNAQYSRLRDSFAELEKDPFTDLVEREPRRDHVTFAFVGGGFAGLMTGARLKEAGVADVRIIDTGGDFGGTWYWNRFPGVQCDCAAMIYMPMLEETGYVPTHKYASGAEILEQCQRIGKQYGLYDNALFHTRVTDLEWNQDARLWRVRTNRGDDFTATFVGWGLGHLSVPKLPGIPGIETFAGHAFHTSRWDFAYTADPAGGPLDRLRDKRVAIIGTGATAVQAVPHLASAAQELFVVQRTPSVIEVRDNRPIDPEWFAEIATPGWQQRWMDNFAANMTAPEQPAEDWVDDSWTALVRLMRGNGGAPGPDAPKPFTEAEVELVKASGVHSTADEVYSDLLKMSEIHARVDKTVKDPRTAALLKPWYYVACKRITFHDEYLEAFNVPTVHLLDTNGQGVERITPRGIVVAGTEYPVDCIIYASGFEVGSAPTSRAGFDPVGRDGERLSEHWASGVRTMHGIHVHGFPNAFLVQPNTGGQRYGNLSHHLSEAAKTVAVVVAQAVRAQADVVEVTQQAEDTWMNRVEVHPEWKAFLGADCTPSYLNNEGPELGDYSVFDCFEGDALEFFQHLQQWRNAPDLVGLEFDGSGV